MQGGLHWRNRASAQVLSDHRGYVVNKRYKYSYFNLPVHSLADLPVIIIEQVKKIIHSIERNEKNTISEIQYSIPGYELKSLKFKGCGENVVFIYLL